MVSLIENGVQFLDALCSPITFPSFSALRVKQQELEKPELDTYLKGKILKIRRLLSSAKPLRQLLTRSILLQLEQARATHLGNMATLFGNTSNTEHAQQWNTNYVAYVKEVHAIFTTIADQVANGTQEGQFTEEQKLVVQDMPNKLQWLVWAPVFDCKNSTATQA